MLWMGAHPEVVGEEEVGDALLYSIILYYVY